VYNKSLHEHVVHLNSILSILRVNHLFANVDNCTFYVDSVVFLGFVVNKSGVHVDLEKIKAIDLPLKM